MGKFKEKIDKSVATVTVKSSTTMEVTKLKNYIKTLEYQIEEKKSILGSLIYRMYKEGAVDGNVYEDICKEIQELELKCEESEKAIEQIKKDEEELLGINKVGKRCECGAILEAESLFCGECGKKVG